MSTWSMIGECSGKMRSTPCPNDTLRTVKVARAPPRCIPITIPSNTWIRSLSPSRTFTCTRTVSPDFIWDRSFNCPPSIASIARIVVLLPSHSGDRPVAPSILHQLAQNGALFVIQLGGGQQFRPPRQSSRHRLPLSPAPDLRVMPREQHVRHLEAAELGWPRVVRVVEQPTRERIPLNRLLVTHGARQQPDDRVEHHQRRQLAAGEDVVADRYFLGRHLVADPLGHALVPAAEDHDMARATQSNRVRLGKRLSLRRREHDRRRLPTRLAHVIDRAEQRRRLEHHPGAAVPRGRSRARDAWGAGG